MQLGYLIIAVLSILFCLRPGWCESNPASAYSSSNDTSHTSSMWLRLGHYRKNVFGNYKSQIDDPEFFISPNGKTDPQKELLATIDALKNPNKINVGRLNQPVHCAFPARTKWIHEQLHIAVPDSPCQERDEWKKALNTQSVTLVFSSAYPNNPASMFGHTLLRLNQKTGNAILDYGVNFEARVVQSDPALIYAFKGLFGLYPGEFSLSPYYMKVNEYSFSESRDLWEYDLKLNHEQIDRLVDHLWEIYSTGGFNYFFLDENCSYQILGLLEVANPDWDLLSPAWLFVLPIDTIKHLNKQNGAIIKESLRPSLHKKMKSRYSLLSSAQKTEWERITSFKEEVNQLQDPATLNAVISFLDYRRQKKGGDLPKDEDQLFRKALIQRAKIGKLEKNEQDVTYNSVTDSPLSTHDTSLFKFGARLRDDQFGLNLGFRISFHDLLDPSNGYPPGLQVEFGSLQLSYFLQSNSIQLNELKFLDILSLHPMNSVDRQFSWALRSGIKNQLDFSCTYCVGGGVEAGPGLSFGFLDQKLWTYGLILANLEYIPSLPKDGRFGPVLEVGLMAKANQNINILSTFRLQTELNHPLDRNFFTEWNLGSSYSFSRNFQVRLNYKHYQTMLDGYKNPNDLNLEIRQYF